MKINWKVRVKNKFFWLALIPAVMLLVQTVVALFGISFDLGEVANKLIAVVNSVFVVLATLGVVNNPTTSGVSDSSQALAYDIPKA